MKLVSANEVLRRASLQIAGTGSTATAESVLDAVTEIVQNLLDTSLALNTRLDVFSYSIPRSRTQFAPYSLYLSSAFLDAATFEIRASTDGSRLSASGEGSVVATTAYEVDYTKGRVTFYEDMTEGFGSLSIYYSNGFTLTDGLLEGTPEWMKEAAISAAIRMLEAQTLTKKKTDARQNKNELATHISMLINSHYRRGYDLIIPMRTVVDP